MENSQDPTISIFLKFDYLTAKQTSDLFGTINAIYDTLANIFYYDSFEYFEGPNIITHHVPLTVKRLDTSKSLDIVLSLAPSAIPSVLVEAGKLHVQLPQWCAIVTLTGVMLRWGMETYEKLLSIIKNTKDLKKSELENSKLKMEIEKLSIDLDKLRHETVETAHLQAQLQSFKSLILTRNIWEVSVNGEKIKESKRDSENHSL